MNREEAKDEAWSYAHAEDVEHVQKLVDIIYDDFDSRTCENCSLGRLWVEDKKYVHCFGKWSHIRIKTHGCNKFKPKETA